MNGEGGGEIDRHRLAVKRCGTIAGLSKGLLAGGHECGAELAVGTEVSNTAHSALCVNDGFEDDHALNRMAST